MKKLYFYGLLVACLLGSKVYAEELTWGSCTTYAPMPVLFIHGINSNCKTWDTTIPELKKYFGYRLVRFNQPEKHISFHPSDKTKGVTYFKDEKTGYESPAKLYLEAFDYSKYTMFDMEYHWRTGWDKVGLHRMKLEHIIEGYWSKANPQKPKWVPGILESYYGKDWKDNPNAKLIIIAHSIGGLVARDYLQRGGKPLPPWEKKDKYVKRLITIGTPHRGTALANLNIALFGKPYQLLIPVGTILQKVPALIKIGKVVEIKEKIEIGALM